MESKIATAEDLQNEIRALWAMTEEPQPSRERLATAIQDLADRVAAREPIEIPEDVKPFLDDFMSALQEGLHLGAVISVSETMDRRFAKLLENLKGTADAQAFSNFKFWIKDALNASLQQKLFKIQITFNEGKVREALESGIRRAIQKWRK
jgi:hypothetical protein